MAASASAASRCALGHSMGAPRAAPSLGGGLQKPPRAQLGPCSSDSSLRARGHPQRHTAHPHSHSPSHPHPQRFEGVGPSAVLTWHADSGARSPFLGRSLVSRSGAHGRGSPCGGRSSFALGRLVASGQGAVQQAAATATTAEQVEQTLRQQGQGEGGGQGQAAQEGGEERAAVSQAGGAGGRRGSGIKTRRVVVTGMGVVSCLGHDPDTFYASLLEGTSGVSGISGFDVSEYPTRIAGEIKEFDYDGYVHPKMAKRMDKYMHYLLTAGKKALEHAGMTPEARETFDPLKCGILIGSAMGGMQIFHDAIEALSVSYRRMNPFCIPFVTTNMGSAMLAMDLGWMGPNYSISTACATSNHCILSAAQHIQRGDADVMLSGGSDAPILPIGLGGFIACKALSKRNDEPGRASRPWDSDRDGFVMGEGAGVLVLEELEHAKARGATIYAEFLGGYFNCDAYHMTDPHPEGKGVRICIEKGLENSGVPKEWVNYVNAHATSTKAGDMQEYKAITAIFGNNPQLKMNATKSMTGHLLGAAGAIEAIATVQAIKTGLLHPTLNLDNPDAGLDPSFMVRGAKEPLKVKVALSNSFGFGGHNSSILFAPYHPDGVAAAVEEASQE